MRKQPLALLLVLLVAPAMAWATVIRVAFSADVESSQGESVLDHAHVEFEGLLEAGPLLPGGGPGETGYRRFDTARLTISNKPGYNSVHHGAVALVTNDTPPESYFWPADWLLISGSLEVPGSDVLGYTLYMHALDGWPALAIPEQSFRFAAFGGMRLANYYTLPYQYEFVNPAVTYEVVPEPGMALALSAAGVLLLRRRAARRPSVIGSASRW